jgi:hypothetical protein
MGTHARRFSQTYCRSDLQSARDWHTVPLSTLTPIEVNKEAGSRRIPSLQILRIAIKDAEGHPGAQDLSAIAPKKLPG